MLGKYLEIFHLGEGESTVVLRTTGNVADLLPSRTVHFFEIVSLESQQKC